MIDLANTIEVLYTDSHKMMEETLELIVYHIDDICPLRDTTYEEVKRNPNNVTLSHGDCWGLKCAEYELNGLLDVVGLKGKKLAFSGLDLLNLFKQEYIVRENVNYKLEFDFEWSDDSCIYQEDKSTLNLYKQVFQKINIPEMLPLTHKLADLYSIDNVKQDENNLTVTIKSIRTGEFEFPFYYVTGDLICDQYRIFDDFIDEILSSNEVKGYHLIDQDWGDVFKDIRTKISEHQDDCEYGCEPCNVFEGLNLKYLDDDEYEIEFRIYIVGSKNIDTSSTIKLSSLGVFNLALNYLKENADLIRKYGREYENMDRDLYHFVESKIGDLETICMHEELLIDYRSEVEEVIGFGRDVFTHNSINEKDRIEFNDLEEFVTPRE